jgi:6-phosphofructokinase
MLKKTFEQLIETQGKDLSLVAIEKAYAEKHGLTTEANEKALSVSVLERLNKETEQLIEAEGETFLQTPINYLKENQEEFVYAEMIELDHIRTDAFALEFDEVFQTYTAMFAVALQKKYKQDIQAHLLGTMDIEQYKSSVAFADKEGVWEMNIALDGVTGFSETLTFAQVYELLYNFVFTLLEKIEQA